MPLVIEDRVSNYFVNILLIIALLISSCATDQSKNTLQSSNLYDDKDAIGINWNLNILNFKDNFSSFVPVFDNNTIYTADSLGNIYKIDVSDGSIISHFKINNQISSGIAAFNDAIFVTTTDGMLLSIGKITHQILWQAVLPNISIEPPLIVSNKIIVRSNGATITAYDIYSGNLLWVYDYINPPLTIRATATMTVPYPNDILIVGFPLGVLAVININNGMLIWQNNIATTTGATDLEKLIDITIKPVIDDKNICVTSFNGNLSCINSMTNEVIWSKPFSSTHQIIINQDILYAINQDNVIYAFNKQTGIILWHNDEIKIKIYDPFVLYNRLLVIDNNGVIYIFNNNGEITRKINSNLLGGNIGIILNNNKVILQSANGHIAKII